MRKRSITVKILSVLLLLMFSLTTFIGCGGGGRKRGDDGYYYPPAPEPDPNIDSWLQLDEDDEDVEITWWIDATTWDFYQLSSLIYKRTGVKVNFKKALKDDGTELSTMIAGNNLPDVITITDFATRVQLFESYKDDKYLYSLTELAKRYAPTLLNRIPEEASIYLAGSNGEIYGLANNFYSDQDIKEFNETGNKILSNYAIVVRKDYLNAYINYQKSINPNFNPDTEITTQDGFVNMCKWVKTAFNLDNANPTVLFSPFPKKAASGSISETVSALSEYFNVPKEDADGNLVYEFGTERFLEVLTFMNRLYRERLVISANFGYTANDLNAHIKNGRPFAVIGAAHNYSKGFAGRSAMGYNAVTKEFNDSYEYVPIVITNKDREAPILLDLAGKGYRVSMITTNCKRPDRVIKVFDYLMSEQGQRECYYGEEGVHFEFLKRPGEKEVITLPDGSQKEHTYTYGKIRWTDYAKEMLGSTANTWYAAGLKQISLLQNPMYVMMTSEFDSEMDTYQFYVRYSIKAPLLPYTYPRNYFKYGLDISNLKRYLDIVDIQEELEALWIRYLPSIVMATSEAQVRSLWQSAMQEATIYGYKDWLKYQNECFKAYKQKIGIQYSWPKNDPNYSPAPVKLLGYPDEYIKEIPDYIRISE